MSKFPVLWTPLILEGAPPTWENFSPIKGGHVGHRELGGAPDPVREDLMEETRLGDRLDSGISHKPGNAQLHSTQPPSDGPDWKNMAG